MMRRNPLLRMAAIGGVAYVGAKAGSNRAAQKQTQTPPAQTPLAAAQTPPTPAPAAPVGAASDRITKLQELASLHDTGALTDDGFANEKARILA